MTLPENFRGVENSRTYRIECVLCGRRGKVGGSWMKDCQKPHTLVCACGRSYPKKQALASHIMMIRRHSGDLSHFQVDPLL